MSGFMLQVNFITLRLGHRYDSESTVFLDPCYILANNHRFKNGLVIKLSAWYIYVVIP